LIGYSPPYATFTTATDADVGADVMGWCSWENTPSSILEEHYCDVPTLKKDG
jgi:hypothetical protein